MNDDTIETKRCSHCGEAKPQPTSPHGGDCCRDCDSSLRSLRRHAGKGRGQLAAQVFVYFECGGGQRSALHSPADAFPRPHHAVAPSARAPDDTQPQAALVRLTAQTAAARQGRFSVRAGSKKGDGAEG